MSRTHTRVAMLLLGLGAWQGGMHSVLAADPRSPVQGDPTQTLPKIAPPKPTGEVKVQVERPDPAMQNLLSARLTPARFQIEGVKTLPFDQIADKFKPLAGKEITVAELLQAANAVTEMYQQQGYPLSFAFVPAQSFENGNVLITVVEGYVARVTIRGNAGPLENRLRAIAERLKEERPLTRASFDRYSSVLGLQPGVQVGATVQPPTTTDGASEMVLEVKRKPIAFGTGVDYMSPGVRAIATATASGLTPLGEQLTVSALFPKGRDDEEYYALGYAQPIGTEGLVARVNASHYRGVPQNATLEQIGFNRRYVNDNKRLGASLSYPLLLSARHSLTLSGGLYGTDQFERYTQAGTDRSVAIGTNVRVVNAELAYVQRKEGVSRSATLGLYKGVDALGARRENNANDLSFLRTRLLLSQATDLPFGFGMAVSAAGQYSGDRLASSEQISFGGRFFGLGYPAGEVAGDKGWGASAEISRLFGMDMTYLKTLQPYVMADVARVYSNSYSLTHRSLSSVALGVRFSDRRYYTLDLSLAQPVGDKPINADRRSPRINASWSYQFD
ncbi:ShlB/FhaC/HecB family hemolysin secretion/activation protein [Cupriavidus gilardii]|uniref:ShlB/FhaC/HecB family hemolysin secretion/activation protein n=1 Tax=Cupriavidus gilardii TaxID=82541 RepID=A0A849BHA8_9BURK|nr:POTRA domain-containing protein [Cupriavidus gilardii]ALD92514.1 peptide transporter [Cupriavidus gilardii CR3]QQE09359.1 ShlB/FhaC/HecB family hemolysin secretion/activation protein [Cupriavidus sp. ISTL7]KAB0596423.1 ShlB/FhaC/HecB family hemolysin secretion/activation protein [Cupriavidus gilardii]MCT9016743.1 ShlB/FhaC/HecB family hemolysin secretion/activation protein [Cupriavidus gilardii]MCT9056333.1 ShlB/FhaC/HecB family hemolysin secretion/activation protein [Cupriavidus gilardii]